MTIEWHDPKVMLPEHAQECLIMPHDHGGFVTVGVFGPIPWNEKMGVWMDLFREKEAGTMVRPEQVGCWTLWEPIAPPDGLPTPWPEDDAI